MTLFLAKLFPAKRSKKPKRKLGAAYNSAPNRTRRQMLNQKLPPRKQPKFKSTGNNLPQRRKPNNNPSTRGTQLKTHK